MNKLNKIAQTPSFKEHAYNEIKNAIISHAMAGGSILSERDLSEKLGISRTPLREALQQLELEGWVVTLPRKGIKVAQISRQDIEEVMQIRKANELLALELLVPQITDQQIQDLYRQFAPERVLNQAELFEITVGDDIHVRLAELCGNRRLVQILKALSEQMRWFGFEAMQIPGRMEEVLQEHILILKALELRDLAVAQERVLDHLMRSRAAIVAGVLASEERSK